MKKTILPTGLSVLYMQRKGKAVIVQLMVNVGSNHEQEGERGISHFLEHVLFEGTVKRPTNQIITNEIERIGGDFNAYTTNERTCFYVKVLRKHFPKAIEILADIIQNSLLKEENIEKEKQIIIKEIDMVHDEPRYYQWVLLQNELFRKHPCRNPTYGNRKAIQSLQRQDILRYLQKHYTAQNMVLSIVGDVPEWKKLVQEQFYLPKGKKVSSIAVQEPPARTITKKEKRKIANTYCVLGFRAVPRKHKDSYVLDVINGILGRGQSGKMFTEIRSKRGLAYEVGTQHVSEVSFGYFGVYATVAKKNQREVQSVIMEQLRNIRNITEEEVRQAKTYIEGDYLLELEEIHKMADQLLFWEQVGKAELLKHYLPKINAVTRKDVQRAAVRYFHHPVTVIIEGR